MRAITHLLRQKMDGTIRVIIIIIMGKHTFMSSTEIHTKQQQYVDDDMQSTNHSLAT